MAKKSKADLDDGYVRIANTIMQELYKLPISNREFRVLLFIIYQTYGYNHKERELSNGYIGKGICVDAPDVCKAVKKLETMKVIKKSLGGKRGAQILKINTHIDEWSTIGNITNGYSTNRTIGKTTNRTIGETANRTIGDSANQYNTDKYNTDQNNTECVGAAQAPPPRTPDFVCFDRLWDEWKFSQAGKNRITQKQRQEIEEIGYYRMADAAQRYYQEFESRTTKNNIPLSARTWFEGAYIQYLPAVDNAGYWFDVKKQLRKGDERV
jgi:phage replication O-like protein O